MKPTEEVKKMRSEFAEISKELDKERGKDKIKRKGSGFGSYRSFVLFDSTEVSQGGWLIGRKWMTAKHMKVAETRWVKHSYVTRADTYLKEKLSVDLGVLDSFLVAKLKEIDREYDLTAGCAQCGGCRWFAAIDGDYGMCCNEGSPNDGRITFEHGGCIEHSYLQELLRKEGA